MGRSGGSAAALAVVLASACTFDTSGSGAKDTDTTSGDDGGTTSAGPGTSPTAPGSMSADGSSGAASDDTGSPPGDTTTTGGDDPSGSTTEPASTGAGESSTGVDVCSAPGETHIVFAPEAEITFPMQLVQSSMLPGMPMVAVSEVAELGTATFPLQLACDGEFRIWGLVWDQDPGADNGPDSYYVTLDRDPAEHDWYYGCQTEDNSGAAWTWQPIMDWVMADCVYDELTFTLESGDHWLTVRNREAGFQLDVAAIAAIVVSSDPSADPNELFDPSP